MKRKFISASLFALLLTGAAGTFVGCSDYDDDIASLQEQITTNATTLNALVLEKVSNVEAEIAALNETAEKLDAAYKAADANLKAAYEAADAGLESAYKAADAEMQTQTLAAAQALVDNAKAELQTAIDATNSVVSEVKEATTFNAEQIAALVKADAALTAAIDQAQADATKAQQLASQAQQRADAAYSLAESAAAKAEANGADVADLKADVEKLKTEKADLATVTADLKTVKETLEKQISALSEEVKGLQTKLAEQKSELLSQMAALDAALEAKLAAKEQEDVEALKKQISDLQAQVTASGTVAQSLVDAAVQKVTAELNAKISDNALAISNLEKAYAAADKELAEQISALSTRVTANEKSIEKVLTTLSELQKKYDNLVNTISIDLSNLITGVIIQDYTAFAEHVYAQVKTFPGDATNYNSNTRTIYFPYKGATGEQTLTMGQYNVEHLCGPIYVTVNPSNVDFSEQQLLLRNSLDQAPANYTLGLTAKSDDHLITTRAANNNGLYAVNVYSNYNTNGNTSVDPTSDKAAYAVAVADRTYKDSLGNAIERNVYSKYEISLTPKVAAEVREADAILKGRDAEHDGNSITFSEADFTTGNLEGTLLLQTNDKPAYRKYVECVGAVTSAGTAANDAVTYLNSLTGFKTVLEEVETGTTFDELPVSLAEKYNGYTFTINYYVWSYDGYVAKQQYKVTFTRPMIANSECTITHTPTSYETQVAGGQQNTPWSQLAWVTNSETFKIFTDNAKSVKVDGPAGMSQIHFWGANGQYDRGTVALDANGDGTRTGLDPFIKNIQLSYDPSKLVIGQQYDVKFKFFDANGHLVNNVTVHFTMNYPDAYDGKVVRIPAAFDGNMTIAWAEYDPTDPTHAYYRLQGSFNNLGVDFGGGSYVQFKDNGDYSYDHTYEPTYYQYTHNNDYKMIVPMAAVDADRKAENPKSSAHVYGMTGGIDYFDVPSLFKGLDNFNLKFYSPIAHAVTTVKEISINYPGEATFSEDQIVQSWDPSKTAGTYRIHYFGDNQDYRIDHLELVDGDKTGNIGLFTTYEIVKDANGNETALHFVTSEKVAIQRDVTYTFKLRVYDVFGCVTEYPVKVKLNPNSSASRHL